MRLRSDILPDGLPGLDKGDIALLISAPVPTVEQPQEDQRTSSPLPGSVRLVTNVCVNVECLLFRSGHYDATETSYRATLLKRSKLVTKICAVSPEFTEFEPKAIKLFRCYPCPGVSFNSSKRKLSETSPHSNFLC